MVFFCLPLFYNLTADELPERYKWLTELIYNEISDESGTLPPCRQMVYKILIDMRPNKARKRVGEFIPFDDPFIDSMLAAYIRIDESNHNSKFSMLYAIFTYMNVNGTPLDKICKYTAQRIAEETDLNLDFPHKELLLMETIVMILLDSAIEGNHRIS